MVKGLLADGLECLWIVAPTSRERTMQQISLFSVQKDVRIETSANGSAPIISQNWSVLLAFRLCKFFVRCRVGTSTILCYRSQDEFTDHTHVQNKGVPIVYSILDVNLLAP